MSDLIFGKKLDYYTIGPDLFVNSNRNGIVTLKSREFINLERQQSIADTVLDESHKPKHNTTTAATWLRSEKERVSNLFFLLLLL